MAKRWLPDWFNCTARKWKIQKRRELNDVLKVVNVYARGSAYTPEYEKFREVREHLRAIRKAVSAKNWGH